MRLEALIQRLNCFRGKNGGMGGWLSVVHDRHHTHTYRHPDIHVYSGASVHGGLRNKGATKPPKGERREQQTETAVLDWVSARDHDHPARPSPQGDLHSSNVHITYITWFNQALLLFTYDEIHHPTKQPP